jgi:DNA polymerase III epsilon subunit-like protein
MANKRFWDVIKSGDFFVIDTETTGLGDDAEVCQIAVVDNNGRTVLDTYVRPVAPIPAEATHVHGITNEMVEKAPGWAEIHVFLGDDLKECSPFGNSTAHLFSLLNAKAWIGYNLPFDATFLSYKFWQLHLIPPVPTAIFDVMQMSAMYMNTWDSDKEMFISPKLINIADHFGYDLDAHNAANDALYVLNCIAEGK